MEKISTMELLVMQWGRTDLGAGHGMIDDGLSIRVFVRRPRDVYTVDLKFFLPGYLLKQFYLKF